FKKSAVYLVAGTVALTACKEENSEGFKRIESLPAAKEQAPGVPPVLGNHPAGPLPRAEDSHAGHDHSHDHAHDHGTTGAPAMEDPNMVIQAGDTEVLAGGNILQAAGLAFTVDES